MAGARGFRARRDAAGRAPGDCSACGEAPGDCSERGQRKFGLNEFPQGECREIVLRGGRKAGGQEIVLGGRMGSSGSKSCRRASAGRLFCVGEWGGGGILFWVGEGGVRARRISAGRASGDCSAWRMGGWGAAGDWSERAKGEFRLGDLPQGECRDIVLRGGAEDGEAAEHCYEREIGELGLEELPRGERRETVLRGARGDGGGGGRLLLSGSMGSSGSDRCRRASAAILFCAGEEKGGAAGHCFERAHGEFGLE